MWRMSKITEIRKRNCSENRFGNRPVGVKYVQGGYREAQLIRRGKKPSSLKIIRNATIRKLEYGFLFAFHSNYDSIAILHTLCVRRPRYGVPVGMLPCRLVPKN